LDNQSESGFSLNRVIISTSILLITTSIIAYLRNFFSFYPAGYFLSLLLIQSIIFLLNLSTPHKKQLFTTRKNEVQFESIKAFLRSNIRFILLIVLLSLALRIINYQITAIQLRIFSENIEPSSLSLFLANFPEFIARLFLIGSITLFSINEEIYFRSIIQSSLTKKIPVIFAIIIPALLFGLLHFNTIAFLPTVILGLFGGIIYQYTRRVIFPILLHISYNFPNIFVNLSVDQSINVIVDFIGIIPSILSIGYLVFFCRVLKKYTFSEKTLRSS
jgi:membrane protease YdiL (CAAX protease family)